MPELIRLSLGAQNDGTKIRRSVLPEFLQARLGSLSLT